MKRVVCKISATFNALKLSLPENTPVNYIVYQLQCTLNAVVCTLLCFSETNINKIKIGSTTV